MRELRFKDTFEAGAEVGLNYLFPEHAEEERRLNPSDYVAVDEIPYSAKTDWADMMERDYYGEAEAPLVPAGRLPERFRKAKKEKRVYMKPKSRKEREKFVLANKFYSLKYGKRGKVRVI